MERNRVEHTFPPFFEGKPEILILGSFPSRKSREEGFYYAHPQNRFYPVLAGVYGEKTPKDLESRKTFLASHRLALYDVVESCEVQGSSDASIRQVKPADLALFPKSIRKILLNGKKAASLFRRYEKVENGIEVFILPSTSPANAAYSLKRLIGLYKTALL